MSELIFRGHGVDITKRNGHFFISYDSGEIASRIVESEITEDESKKAQNSEQDAYEVILAAQSR